MATAGGFQLSLVIRARDSSLSIAAPPLPACETSSGRRMPATIHCNERNREPSNTMFTRRVRRIRPLNCIPSWMANTPGREGRRSTCRLESRRWRYPPRLCCGNSSPHIPCHSLTSAPCHLLIVPWMKTGGELKCTLLQHILYLTGGCVRNKRVVSASGLFL